MRAISIARACRRPADRMTDLVDSERQEARDNHECDGCNDGGSRPALVCGRVGARPDSGRAERLAPISALQAPLPDQFGSGWCASLDIELAFAPPSAGDVIGRLHPHQRVHLDPERFLDTQRHHLGQVRPAIQKGGERGPGHAKYLRGGGYGQTLSARSPRSSRMHRGVEDSACAFGAPVFRGSLRVSGPRRRERRPARSRRRAPHSRGRHPPALRAELEELPRSLPEGCG